MLVMLLGSCVERVYVWFPSVVCLNILNDMMRIQGRKGRWQSTLMVIEGGL